MYRSIDKGITITFIAISLLIFFLAFFTHNIARKDVELSDKISHRYMILYKSDRFLSALQDIETGSRGFVITGDSSYLSPFLSGKKQMDPLLKELRELLAADDLALKHVDSLEILAAVRLQTAEEAIDVRLREGFEKANGIITIGKGKRVMNQLRRINQKLQQEQNTLLNEHIRENKPIGKKFFLVFLMLFFVLIMLVTFSFFSLRSYIMYKRKNEKEMETINRELEKRVEEKTSSILMQEKRYHMVLDNMLEGAQMLSYDWHYLYLNNAALTHSKYEGNDLLGHRINDKYPGIERTELFQKLRISMEQRIAQLIENEFVYPDNSKGYFQLSVQPVPEGLFILSMDISERKKREIENLQRTQEHERILFKISHEIRLPVCHLAGLSALLDDVSLNEKELKQFISYTRESIALLDSYTKDLTEYVHTIKNSSLLERY